MAALMDYFRRSRSRYTPLPTNEAASGPPPSDAQPGQASPDRPAETQPERTRRAIKLAAVALMLLMLIYLAVAVLRAAAQKCDTPERGFQCSPETSHAWGQYSPYFSVPSEIDAAIPQDCELTFAQVLSRHGARAPTHSKAVFYAKVIAGIHAAATSYAPGYEFLKAYNYALGEDQLTALGQQEMAHSGEKFYRRYHTLTRTWVPFIRSAGQDRVVQSAYNFTLGFHAALRADRKATAPHSLPYDMLVIPEDAGVNNTLSHGLCTAFEDGAYSAVGNAAQTTYLSHFAPPITTRLNAALPGANLTDAAAIALMDLCPYETVASLSGDLSAFCRLFMPAEWLAYDYYQSLGKWYGYGPGNPLGPTQGVGFVNELLARLTGTPVEDATSTNATLDGDKKTFPLDRVLYADFSHDNDIMGILGALGVYGGVKALSNTTRIGPEDDGGFAASWAVPFASRVYVEKMRCGKSHGKPGGKDQEKPEELVRVLVNDRVMPLKGCGADKRGMCALGKFVDSMAFARGNGRWDLCFP